jgi:hypothetical protein
MILCSTHGFSAGESVYQTWRVAVIGGNYSAQTASTSVERKGPQSGASLERKVSPVDARIVSKRAAAASQNGASKWPGDLDANRDRCSSDSRRQRVRLI